MNKSQLLKEYFFLTNVVRNGVNIAVCRHREDFTYNFFTNDNSNFQQVQQPVAESLARVYNNTYLGYDTYSVSDGLSPIKVDLEKNIEFCKRCINNFTKDLESSVSSHIQSNVNSLKFLSSAEYQAMTKIPNIPALYQSAGHFIAGRDNQLLRPHVLLHEMLHASSKSIAYDNCGFRVMIPKTNKAFGKGINESATDYFVQEMIPYDPTLSTMVDMFGKLIEGCDFQKIKKFYFKSYFNSFVNYLTEFYKLEDGNDIILTIDLFDCLYNCIMFKQSEDYLNWTQTLYKQIIRLQMQKHFVENDEIDSYKFTSLEFKQPQNRKLKPIIDDFICQEKTKYNSLYSKLSTDMVLS